MGSHKEYKSLSTEKISNKNYESDIKHTLVYTRCYLGILGVWPMASQDSTKMEKRFSKLLIIVCLMSPAFVLIPITHYVILREKNMIARLVVFAPIGFFVSNFLKYVIMVFRCGMIKLCIEHVKDDWMGIECESDRATMKRSVKVGHDLTVACSAFIYSCGLLYHTVTPLKTGITINEFNETVRPLVYPGFDAFVDAQLSPIYEIVSFTVCVSAFFAFTVTTATCNVAAIFVTHACGQIQILISRLGSLVDQVEACDHKVKIRERVSCVIRCHMRALRLASTIELMLREICLVEVVATTFTICLVEHCLMTELDNGRILGVITYAVGVVSQSLNVYIFCHIGELLKEQYHQVGVAAYMIEWYRLRGKTGRDLIMIIIMASTPRKLTAGGMIELTISSFGTIIKMSITYFNMLRELTD